VVLTGGEPTCAEGIVDWIALLKGNGFKVKLNTNGYAPEILHALLAQHLLDYVAMDVKAPLYKYSEIIQTQIDTSRIKSSISLIMDSGVEYEFRTTVWKDNFSEAEYRDMFALVGGARRYVLQNYFPTEERSCFKAMTSEDILPILQVGEEYVKNIYSSGIF
jgi:pyruvate formate lyase activating enzyme